MAAAYAAVISLKHTINSLLNSSRISSTQKILESAYNETRSLQHVLKRSLDINRNSNSNERLDGLEGQIRDFAHKPEDILEFHEDEEVILLLSKKMEKVYIQELTRDNNDDEDLSRFDFGKAKLVGHSNELNILRGYLAGRMRPDELWFYAFYGDEVPRSPFSTMHARADVNSFSSDGRG